MDKRLLLTLALLAVACRDAVSPGPHGVGSPALAGTAGSGITLDQQNGTFDDVVPWSNGGSHVGMAFTPQNPHVGDAIVATFFWVGSTNTIIDVTDHLEDAAETPVGNTYRLVDYVTSNGISMATYVATNVHGFPDASTNHDSILAVHAIFSPPISNGGELISAWTGVSSVDADALGPHTSASGSGTTPTIADPGAIAVNAHALVFGVTMSDRLAGLGTPPGFTGSVSIAIGHNGGLLLHGTLSGTKTVPVVNGVATFSDLSIDQLGNGYTLVVSAPGATSAESTPFNIGLF